MAHRIHTLIFALLLLALSAHPRVSQAQLTIEIIGGGGTTIPISIVPFQNEVTYPQGITGVVTANLNRSGQFRSIDSGSVTTRPTTPAEVRYGDWQARGADALVVGSMRALGDGRVEVRFHLLDVAKQAQLVEMSFTVTPPQFRATAHKIADVIYETLTGARGVFSTRIAYVSKQGSVFGLVVADADGENPVQIVRSPEPLLSPSWSPDGTRLAYVSLENRKPVVYVQSLATGTRQTVANFRGSNSAPAWSPDSRRLAVTLTKDGGSQLYLLNVDGAAADAALTGAADRLMSSSAIDTEPNFSPDGQTILFTSDRGGSPQIYRLSLANRNIERMTFEGSYNTSPRHSPDGKSFTYIRREGGRFFLVIQDFATRQTQVLTQGPMDESPSFAPNSRMLLYAAAAGGRGILAAVSSDGRVKQRLTASSGDVREPAWGPFPK